MSIWDGDYTPLNIPMPTLGGQVFWDMLDYKNGYTLQKHILEGHCRILDEDDYRIAWGTETQMRAKFRELTELERHAKYGDIIGVHRIGSVYDHYGVYESDDVIYHYAAENGDFGQAIVHITTLDQFIGDSDNYFVLEFSEKYGKPAKVAMTPNAECCPGALWASKSPNVLRKILASEYHLYSAEETIQRAKGRLGETKYNLITNNCEHFAIWCKTGLHESHQVSALFDFVNRVKVQY